MSRAPRLTARERSFVVAFTSILTVRRHLLGCSTPPQTVENVPVRLDGLDPVPLPHHGLLEKSEVVKWSVETAPVTDGPLELAGYGATALSHRPVVAASEVVALNLGLGPVYAAEHDYQLDAAAGTIRRVTGSQIDDPRYVFVHYLYYQLFERDIDYELDIAAGLIRRTENGAIPDGAQVLVDYTLSPGTISDELIEQAVAEAHDRIVRALATGYSATSNDQGLQTGETELVLAILARDQAAETLALHSGSDTAGRAREWRELWLQHEAHAWQTLRPFLDPYTLRGPEKRNAGA
jgi:hypothetical protein